MTPIDPAPTASASAAHWDAVHRSKPATQVSWYQEHAALSLDLIRRTGASRDARIVDVGGGVSTLVDDLVGAGYRHVTVLDISSAALDVARARLGERAAAARWIVADILRADLRAAQFDVWHDRAVFHFLVDPADRRRYVAQVRRAVKPGGHVIVGTFAADGPETCSGLPVARYDPAALHGAFGAGFELVASARETHVTPSGTAQRFTFCWCRAGAPSRPEPEPARRADRARDEGGRRPGR